MCGLICAVVTGHAQRNVMPFTLCDILINNTLFLSRMMNSMLANEVVVCFPYASLSVKQKTLTKLNLSASMVRRVFLLVKLLPQATQAWLVISSLWALKCAECMGVD